MRSWKLKGWKDCLRSLQSRLVCFFQCSVTCGQGERHREISCGYDNGHISSDCDPNSKPASVMECVLRACPVWHEEPWSEVRSEGLFWKENVWNFLLLVVLRMEDYSVKSNLVESNTSTFLLCSVQSPAVKAPDDEVLTVDSQMAS